MAHASADPGLDEYRRLGGNCLHIHDEGGESRGRRATGDWLRRHGVRREFFLCSQICHDGWDEASQTPIDRFTPEAIAEDIGTELELLQTDYLDCVYLSDNPRSSFEPVIDALARESESGRVRAYAVSNWTPARLRAVDDYARRTRAPRIAALVTTELAMLRPAGPLWPEYVPFETELEQTIRDLGLTVFAHALDLNLGMCLFEDSDALSRMRPWWVERWKRPGNEEIARRLKSRAAELGTTPRALMIRWMLERPYPVFPILSLPALQARRGEYEQAAVSAADAPTPLHSEPIS